MKRAASTHNDSRCTRRYRFGNERFAITISTVSFSLPKASKRLGRSRYVSSLAIAAIGSSVCPGSRGVDVKAPRMFLGLHVGTSTGYDAAVAYARRLGCSAIQIFSGNPKTYRVGPIDAPALGRFAAARAEAGIERTAIHTSYLINLASDVPRSGQIRYGS